MLEIKVCSKCGKEKVNGYCQPCKSEQRRIRTAEKRIAMGLPPIAEGREAHCKNCITRVSANEDIRGEVCNECQKIARRKRIEASRLEQGVPAKSDTCLKCGELKTSGRCLPCNNKVKQANRAERNRLKRAEEGKAPWGTRELSPCITCGKTKENPNKSYCNECINSKAREKWKETEAIKHNKREITSLCECGKTKSSTQKIYCDDCSASRRKEQSRIAALEFRKIHGSKVKRGIHCSMCKGIKEHQDRGYCLACERIRYLKKDKPDCATCGAIKKNPRDAYCGPCKYAAIKARRPFRTYEQIFKDNVRKFTWARINDGTLIRLPCEVCGITEGVDAHHDDYHNALAVRWLCKYHHVEHHNNEKIKD